jgi:dCMP deaminase
MNKLSWNEVWATFANTISQRSSDTKLKVGAVIVPFDNTGVLSLGYNGDEKGGSNIRESECSGNSGFIHAEINALIKLDFNNPKPKKMYITHSPCRMCAKAIINADIKEVYYVEEYTNDFAGIKLLQEHNIKTTKI